MCARVGPSTVEIAVLVRDDHQRRGVGTALVTALREEAAAMGAVSVELTTGADNRAVVAMVSARAPGLRARRDGTTLVYRLPLPPAGPDAGGTRSLRWESPLRRTARTHHCDTRTGPQHDRRGLVLPSGA